MLASTKLKLAVAEPNFPCIDCSKVDSSSKSSEVLRPVDLLSATLCQAGSAKTCLASAPHGRLDRGRIAVLSKQTILFK